MARSDVASGRIASRSIETTARVLLLCCWFAVLSSVLILTVGATEASLRLPPATTQPQHQHYHPSELQQQQAARHPPLGFIEEALLTVAKQEFGGSQALYESAANWTRKRLAAAAAAAAAVPDDDLSTSTSAPAPYIGCADYGHVARKAALRLAQDYLSSQPAPVRMLTPDRKRRLSCFVATATAEEALAIESEGLENVGLTSFGPFPTVLKIAPGLLHIDRDVGDTPDYDGDEFSEAARATASHTGGPTRRLTTTHGHIARMENIEGLVLVLSPGVVSGHRDATTEFRAAQSFSQGLMADLMSSTLDLHASNYWSDRDTNATSGERDVRRTSSPASALRAREWSRAADVVHGLSTSAEDEGSGGVTITPGDVCSWDSLRFHHPAGGNSLTLTGLDHLLPAGRGAGGRDGEESQELQAACFMGLLSYLASVPEVLRVSPSHRDVVLNAVAKAISQSATLTDTPLTDSGLDGSGEVIQIVDSGVDQNSCYFSEEDGSMVELGHYFEELAFVGETSTASRLYGVLLEGYYPVEAERRKIIQYISLIDADGDNYGDGTTTIGGGELPWYTDEGFGTETSGGHGSHTAGTAAGAILTTPTVTCESAGESLGCVGGCINASNFTSNSEFDIDTMCPEYACDGYGEDYEFCLQDDTQTVLTSHEGVARSAKLAIFDASPDGEKVWASFAGNGPWEAANETGAMVHSNSWGGDTLCLVDATAAMYDVYMYNNPEHLLIFAAGNDGDIERSACTISSPAIGKNVLAVGASSSGADRWTVTGVTGVSREVDTEAADMDTVAYFSSRGLTSDNRIKPEIVAPGDQVLSVSSAGATGSSCVLELQAGTSMATPVVAGAAAMIRQYFRDSDFYVADAIARGLCPSDQLIICESFSPSAATIKAMLINSAHLMGGSSEPDGERGFGRVHLQAGLPLNGEGDVGLYVADSARSTSIAEDSEVNYKFVLVDGDTGEFRATLSWIDPSADSELVATQLTHDLDLTVTSPSGTVYTMWSSGARDSDNTNERVIVPSEDVESEGSGEWLVTVSSEEGFSMADYQTYSLVVTGPFGNGTVIATSGGTRARGMGGMGGLARTIFTAVGFIIGVCSLIGHTV